MASTSALAAKPNVLFIAVDDLNDWVGHLRGHPNAKTPNIDRLASQGVSFTHAYCAAPLCNPSRISLLTGILPSNSGVYGNGEKLRDKLPHAETLMQYFRSAGYTAKGAGKIFHGANSPGDPASWDEYFVASGMRRGLRPARPSDVSREAWIAWGAVSAEDDDMTDGRVAAWAAAELAKEHARPFFLACGFFKPHMPWFVPQRFFDMHPLESITLPATKDDDLNDVPPFGKRLAREVFDPSGDRNFATPGGDHNNILKHHQWKNAVQGYLAAISFADAQVGKLLEALQSGPNAENTIVILWGDHGWHLGQKQHWRKHAVWEVSSKTPLVISAPGIAQGRLCHRPVGLIDIYPTLVELCGLPPKAGLDGQSIVPLLQDPMAPWDRPVLTTYGYRNHSIRTARWRYIRYHDGTDDLYDRQGDPREWTNLANDPEYEGVIRKLRTSLPKANRPATSYSAEH